MVDLSWKDVAALWGAGLSTWLALTRLLPSRPRLHVEPPEDTFLNRTVIEGDDVKFATAVIRVVNPAKRMVYVRDLLRVRLRGSVNEIALHTGKSSLALSGRPGSLRLLLPPEAQTEAEAMFDEDTVWLVVFVWQQPWLMPVWMPVVLVVSGERIKRYRDAAKQTVLPQRERLGSSLG